MTHGKQFVRFRQVVYSGGWQGIICTHCINWGSKVTCPSWASGCPKRNNMPSWAAGSQKRKNCCGGFQMIEFTINWSPPESCQSGHVLFWLRDVFHPSWTAGGSQIRHHPFSYHGKERTPSKKIIMFLELGILRATLRTVFFWFISWKSIFFLSR